MAGISWAASGSLPRYVRGRPTDDYGGTLTGLYIGRYVGGPIESYTEQNDSHKSTKGAPDGNADPGLQVTRKFKPSDKSNSLRKIRKKENEIEVTTIRKYP